MQDFRVTGKVLLLVELLNGRFCLLKFNVIPVPQLYIVLNRTSLYKKITNQLRNFEIFFFL